MAVISACSNFASLTTKSSGTPLSTAQAMAYVISKPAIPVTGIPSASNLLIKARSSKLACFWSDIQL